MKVYDGNPYASEQGPADEDTDYMTDLLEAADEHICEFMGEWATVAESQLPDDMAILQQARECIHNAIQERFLQLAERAGMEVFNGQIVEPKPGNECRFCSNWVDVQAGYDTCQDCLKKQ